MSKDNNQINFIVTARKWRPLLFKDVVGQEHITKTMQNALRTNRMHHALLFSGPRGVGKTTTARILARALNCENLIDSEPCNQCSSCLSILDSKSMDVIEIDGASNNSVDDIRKLRENSKYPPSSSRYKMYIIDEVHMLSTSAFNALLKTLEEPPPHLLFVFATTEQHKVPATILSRCQRHEFRRMEMDKIISHLTYIAEKEEIEIDNESLITIARKADGSMRDSQSIFDQVVAFSGKNVIYSEMVDALHLIDTDFFFRISQAGIDKNFEEMLLVAKDISNKGYDLQECLGGLLEHYRNLLTVKVTNKLDLIDAPDSFIEKYKKFSDYYSKPDLMRILNLISSTEQALRFTSQPKVKFELCLLNLASIDNAIEISELLTELKSGKGLSQNNSNSVAKDRNSSFTVSSSKLSQSPKIVDSSLKVEKTEEAKVQKQPMNVDLTNQKSDKANLENSWQEFLNKFAKAEFGLQYLTQSYCTPVFLNQEVVLNASGQIIFENITNNKKNILHYLEVFFGHKISIKILQNDTGSSLAKDANTDSSLNSNSGSSELNPLEKTIVNLFGAKVSPR